MKWSGLCAVFTLLFATQVGAQELIVRSGEHEGYSRLVMQIPKGTGWSLKKSEREAELKVGLPGVQFDVTQVYQRISRDRLLDISQDRAGNALTLRLGCACDVTGVIQSGSFIVIDIKDPQPQKSRLNSPVRAVNQPIYRFQALPRNTEAMARPPAAPKLRAASPIPAIEGQQSVDLPVGIAPPVHGQHVNASERRLLAQISRATNQGLLTIRANPEPAFETDRADSADAIFRHEDSPQLTPGGTNVSVITVIDRDMNKMAKEKESSLAQSPCLASEAVALATWASDRPYSEQIGQMRSELFSEFDKLNPHKALAIAQASLFFGFGAEAASILSMTVMPETEHSILMALSKLVDNGRLDGINPFFGQQGCEGDVALWAVLAGPAKMKGINKAAVQRAFSRLPAHLRVHLSSHLSHRFSENADVQTAAAILRAVNRIGVKNDPAIDMAEAAIASLRNNVEILEKKLNTVVETGSEKTPHALIELVGSHVKNSTAIEPDLPDLVASYLLEYRKSELGPELRRTHTTALALSGRFPEAFETLSTIRIRDGDFAAANTMSPILAQLTDRADDVTFMRFALRAVDRSEPTLPVDIADKLARRLLDLGFPGIAMQVLSRPLIVTPTPTRRLMRAEAALGQGLPHRAMVDLFGLEGREASRLRAAAMWQNGDYREAGHMLLAANDPDAAVRGFWLSEEWGAIPDGGDQGYRMIAGISQQLTEVDDDGDLLPPLAMARALVDSSLGTRRDIAEILQKISAEPEAP